MPPPREQQQGNLTMVMLARMDFDNNMNIRAIQMRWVKFVCVSSALPESRPCIQGMQVGQQQCHVVRVSPESIDYQSLAGWYRLTEDSTKDAPVRSARALEEHTQYATTHTVVVAARGSTMPCQCRVDLTRSNVLDSRRVQWQIHQ